MVRTGGGPPPLQLSGEAVLREPATPDEPPRAAGPRGPSLAGGLGFPVFEASRGRRVLGFFFFGSATASRRANAVPLEKVCVEADEPGTNLSQEATFGLSEVEVADGLGHPAW